MHFRISNTVGQAYQIKSISAYKLHFNKLQAISCFSIDIIHISLNAYVTFVNTFLLFFSLYVSTEQKDQVE